MLGLYIPYFNLYCRELGFSGFQIGILLILQPLSRLLFPVLWGLYADRFGRRDRLIKISYGIAAVTFGLLIFIRRFPLFAVVLWIYTFFIVPVLPLWEAAVLERLKVLKRDYGPVRTWGSLGFITFSLLGGFLMDRWPTRIMLWVMVVISVVNVFQYSRVKVDGYTSLILKRLDFSWLKSRKLIVFLVPCALIHASHGSYYGYFSIFMRAAGHSNQYIGFLWTLGVLSEVVVLFFSGRLLRRWGHGRLFGLALLGTSLRWLFSAMIYSGPLFMLIQLLHGLSFGLFHVCSITHIQELVPSHYRSTAQSLYSSAAYGLGGLAGFLMNGLLYDSWGMIRLWVIDGILAAAALGIFLFSHSKSKVNPIY